MFEFTSKYINKKAFKRALKEVAFEEALSQYMQNGKEEFAREYKTEQESSQIKKTKFSGALAKPQTEAVDLKHFKDWRDVEKVKSNISKPSNPKVLITDEDDEGEQPSIENPVKVNKPISISQIIHDDKDDFEEKDKSVDSFFQEKYQTVNQDNSSKKAIFETEEPQGKTNKYFSIRNSVKTSLNELLNKKKQKEAEINDSDINVVSTDKIETDINDSEKLIDKKETNNQTNISQSENKNEVKIEVVDFSEKKKAVKKDNKMATRKPRGKNKRRFDADVISSVDWK